MKDIESTITTLDILDNLQNALNAFVDMPSEENLACFDKLCSEYKETWIKEASSERWKTSVPKPINIKEYALKDDEMLNNLIAERAYVNDLIALQNDDEKDLLIQKINDVDSRIRIKEIARASSDDGNVKILTHSIKHQTNKASVGSIEYDLEPIDFHQHAIRAIRPSEKPEDKKFNRRWYFEKEGESKIAWWCDRGQMISMIEHANSKGMLKSSLDNKTINDNYQIIKSNDLDPSSYDEYLKSFTLFEERNAIFHSDKEVFFMIFESKSPRTKIQLARNAFEESILDLEPEGCTWRDICILDSTKVTIRSVTDDPNHKPSVKVLDSNWYISNDMSSIPNQAMREFIKLIHPELRLND